MTEITISDQSGSIRSVDASLLTGGNVDTDNQQVDAIGEEAVGGTAVTPDMNVVDDLGKAVGLEMGDQRSLDASEILERRDQQRWELEPTSAEDYNQRQDLEYLDQ